MLPSHSPFTLANAIVPHLACAREELAILVEARGHDAIRGVKCLLHAVAVMHVDVDVQDTLVISDRR
jgi:hypothetical protein